MSQEPRPSSVQEWISLGLSRNYIRIERGKLFYVAVGKGYRFSDPEEPVRGAFYVELIERYGYQPHHIDTEVRPPRREPKTPADLVVFHDNKRKRPYAVVECKREDASAADIETGLRTALGNANSLGAAYGMLVAGNVRIVFDPKEFDLRTREGSEGDLPVRYGKPPEYRYHKGIAEKELTPTTQKDLETKFQQCHDILWEGGRRNPIEAFDEMSKLMLAKLRDERVGTARKRPYGFQCGRNETVAEVAARVRTIYDEARRNAPSVFQADINVPDRQLYRIVEILQGVSLNRTDPDAKGKAFEQFMNGKVFRGEMGQYFTDRHIVEFVTDVLKPSERDKIIDPACGSGGFLLWGFGEIRRSAEEHLEPTEAVAAWKDWARTNLQGIDINEQISRVAMMDMIIHDDGHSNIKCADALSSDEELNSIKDGITVKSGTYSLVMTNPPFGAVVSPRSRGNGSAYFHLYGLGGKDGRRSQKTEVLFIERCLNLLAPGGRMCIVLPDGVLNNSSLQYVRDFISERAEITAVVSLPDHTFVPYGSGVKASLLFLRKARRKRGDSLVFMGITHHIGYDATGRVDPNQLPKIAAAFHDQREAPDPECFLVSSGALGDRFDPWFHRPMFARVEAALRGARYPVRALGELLREPLAGGETPTAKSAAYTSAEDGVPFLRIQNVTDDGIVFTDMRYVRVTIHDGRLRRSQLQPNDIVMSITGRVGTATVVPASVERANINQHLVRIRVTDEVLPEYVALYLNSDVGRIVSNRRVSGGSRIALDYSAVQQIVVPVPPLAVQHTIVQQVASDRAKAEKVRKVAEATVASARNRVTDALGL